MPTSEGTGCEPEDAGLGSEGGELRREIRSRLAGLSLDAAREAQIVEELAQHLEDRCRERIETGVSKKEAHAEALESLGEGRILARNIRCASSRTCRGSLVGGPGLVGDRRRRHIVGDLWLDLRYSFRALVRSRTLTAVSLLTLGLGIGGTSAIFSIVNGVLLRELPFANPSRLVWIWATHTDRDKAFFSIPDFRDMADQNSTLDGLAGTSGWAANLTGNGDPERLYGVRVTSNTFSVLGARALVGRTLEDPDARPEAENAVVLSYNTWKNKFGAELGIVGRAIVLNDDSYTVVGVLPPDFFFPGQQDAEMASALRLDSDPRRTERGTNFIRAFARLKAGATLAQARSDLASITARLREMHPDTNYKYASPKVLALSDEIGGDYRAGLMVLFGAVGLVLLIACSNLAIFLLARGPERRREVCLRAALGASRGRVIRQLMTESMMLGLIGGLAGLSLAWRAIPLLMTLAPADLPRAQNIRLDWSVLGFAVLLSLLSSLMFGLAPAIELSKADLNEAIKGQRAGSSGRRGNKVRKTLIALEIALSLVLLDNAGLLIKSFGRLNSADPGFSSDNRLIAQLSLPSRSYRSEERIEDFYNRLEPRLLQLPGVRAAGLVSLPPLSGLLMRSDFSIVGYPAMTPEEMPGAQTRWVSPGYFDLMGIPVKRGRDFSNGDKADQRGVVLIDEATARQFFAGLDPVGKHITIDDLGPKGREAEVIGIVGNVKNFRLEESPLPTIYFPFYQVPAAQLPVVTSRLHLVVETESNPLSLGPAVRREVQNVDSRIPASYIKTMDQYLASALASRRFDLSLLGVFALLALVLAGMGVYGVVSYWVTERTGEIGIRMALGAGRAEIMTLIISAAARPVLAGLGVGLSAALSLSRAITSLLYGVTSTDATIYLLALVTLIGVALVATWIPARRLARSDTASALRIG